MRIALLSVSAEMGGSEVSLLSLVRGLRRQVPDWAIDVIVPREGALSRAVTEAGAQAHVLPLPETFSRIGERSPGRSSSLVGRGAALALAAGGVARYGRTLSRLLTRIGPDIVHTNGFKMHVLGARARPPGAALVWHMHEYVAQRPISRRLLGRYVGRCDAIVANSHSVAAEIGAALKVPSTVPVTTIHNAVDAGEFAPDGERADLDRLSGLPPAPPRTIRVGLVATYGRWKGHATFIEAIRRLPEAAAIRGYIIGGALYDTGGSQFSRDELAAAIAAAGLAGRIGLTGFVERPATAYRALDVVVHASTEPEPFGLVIAEGLASGRAVVVSAAGGAAELVQDGVDALTHPPGDAGALSDCLARLAGDSALRAALGARGRLSATRRFSPDVFAGSFVDVYRRAAAARVGVHANH